MRFAEIDVLGVYIAPISVMLVAAWMCVIALRRIAARIGLLRHVWHPALFVFAVYMIILSSAVLIFARCLRPVNRAGHALPATRPSHLPNLLLL
jgi:protein AaeX